MHLHRIGEGHSDVEKQKNKLNQAYLSNFTTFVMHRDVYCPAVHANLITPKRMSEISSDVNYYIQQLNIMTSDRNIPYIQASVKKLTDVKDVSDQTRLIIDNENECSNDDENTAAIQSRRKNISHIVDCYIVPCQNKYTDGLYGCDGRFIVDDSCFDKGVKALLLDICVYHSYSFLDSITIPKEKEEFNRRKLEFCKKLKQPCSFNIDGKYKYISLAFFAMDSNGVLNVKLYKKLWDDFIRKYYNDCIHKEEPIIVQLQRHVDLKQLPDKLDNTLIQRPSGAYLILRTNKDRTESIHPTLFAAFGIKKSCYRQGIIRIVPLSHFNQYRKLLQNLDVSAFKIVKGY